MSMKFKICDYTTLQLIRIYVLLIVEMYLLIGLVLSLMSLSPMGFVLVFKYFWWAWLVWGAGIWGLIHVDISHKFVGVGEDQLAIAKKSKIKSIPKSKITGFSINAYPWFFKDHNGERIVAVIVDRRYDFLWKPKIIKFTGKKQALELLRELHQHTGKPIFRRNFLMMKRPLKV